MKLSHAGIIAIIALGTFSLRLSFIYLSGKVNLPEYFTRAMKYVPPAALAALVLPAVLYPGETLELTLENEYLLAAAAAGIAAYKTNSFFATVGVGMIILWSLRALLQ